MSQRETWNTFFKPEVQKTGDDLVKENAVILTVTSDTAINALVRGGGNPKVSLTSKSIADKFIMATCSCSRAEKGILCKHIWAVMEMTEKKHPDFLDSKTEIEIKDTESTAPSAAQEKKNAYKEKQAAFKKSQSDKIKARNKEIRLAKKEAKKSGSAKPVSSKLSVIYPDEVTAALKFFSVNGFDLETPLVAAEIKEARKSLSRVFHPDKGGTHAESLELNKHYDTLMEYAGS
jgi:hypothetical protein